MTMRQRAASLLAALTARDQMLWQEGTVFAGIDEAGCGPLAGPVAAACVIMPPAPLIEGINDSKKVTEKRRELLYERIREVAVFYRVSLASVAEIERLNIRGATRLAMARAGEDAPAKLFLIDGIDNVVLPGEQQAIIQGDALYYSIAAASILAKVTRDRIMRSLDAQYPQYGFAKHKGYGTAEHIAALRAYGPCPEHRARFIRKFV